MPTKRKLLTETQKDALRFFLTLPIIFAVLTVLVILTSESPSMAMFVIYNMIAAFSATIVVILLTADIVRRKANCNQILGGLYGISLLVIGATAFNLTNWLQNPEGTFVEYILIPVGWVCLYGWVIAGYFGSGFINNGPNEPAKSPPSS